MLRHLSVLTSDLLVLHEPLTALVCLTVLFQQQEPCEQIWFVNPNFILFYFIIYFIFLFFNEIEIRIKGKALKAAQKELVHTEQLQ